MSGTIFSVLKFPKPWPPKRELQLLRQNSNGEEVLVSVDPDGRLCTKIISSENSIEEWFPVISIEGDGECILCVRWQDSKVDLFLNSTKPITPSPRSQNKTYNLITKTRNSEFTLDPEIIIGDIDIPEHANEGEELFLRTLLDIEKKLLAGTRYDILRASALLRQLTVDGLVHVANKEHKIKNFTYRVIKTQGSVVFSLDTGFLNLDPHMFPGANTVEVTSDEFLALPCCKHNGSIVTVKEVISTCANAKGGVHFKKARDAQKHMLSIDSLMQFDRVEISLVALAGICRVYLRGLLPLVDVIQQKK